MRFLIICRKIKYYHEVIVFLFVDDIIREQKLTETEINRNRKDDIRTKIEVIGIAT